MRDPQEPQARMDQLAVHPAFEPALRDLAARPDRITEVWTRKYLDHFQDRPYLTSGRVNRVLGPLTRQYLDCLVHLDMTRFSEELERSARSFFELSTPFEEVLLCVHLFREACVAVLTESAADGQPLPQDLLLAFDELAQFGSSVMSAAYYRDVQRQWELRSAEARRENDAMRRQIETLEQDLFSLSSKRFSEIDRTVSKINRKISDSSVHYREVYELTRRLEHARDIPSALGIFFRSVLKNLPQECELHCGLLDERKAKLRIYSPRRDRASVRAELTSECRLSVLVPEHRESLFDPPFRKVVRQGTGDSVETVFAPSRLDRAGEYAFFPVSFHDEPLGFVWAASAAGHLLTPERIKLLERFAKILSGSVFGLQNFLRNQKHAKLVAAIETELTPDRTAQWEESLDRYLNVFLDLTGVELQGANLENADLRGATLRGADLRGARLSGANLVKADLRGAMLGPLPISADRSMPTDLTGARLRYAQLQQADLHQAGLKQADLRGADVTGADMREAMLAGAALDEVEGLHLAA